MLYFDAIYYVRLLWFNKNHKFEYEHFIPVIRIFAIYL
jgi:hypothetical protein